jgi:hypothetical protein
MKMIWKFGRWLIITFVLLSLTGHMRPDGSGRQEAVQVATLVRLARTDLRARLGIPAEVIALESTWPLIFPGPAPDTCQERQPGYIIRLAADSVVYEYHARMLGEQYILWHEVESGQPLLGERNGRGTMPVALQQMNSDIFDMLK